jgi:hypothetical protein
MSSALSALGIICGFSAAFVVILGCIRLASQAEHTRINVARPQPVQLRSVRCDPIVLRRLREQERKRWARDDIESARQEKGGWVVHQSPIRK